MTLCIFLQQTAMYQCSHLIIQLWLGLNRGIHTAVQCITINVMIQPSSLLQFIYIACVCNVASAPEHPMWDPEIIEVSDLLLSCKQNGLPEYMVNVTRTAEVDEYTSCL